jgi:hypothetical protein
MQNCSPVWTEVSRCLQSVGIAAGIAHCNYIVYGNRQATHDIPLPVLCVIMAKKFDLGVVSSDCDKIIADIRISAASCHFGSEVVNNYSTSHSYNY